MSGTLLPVDLTEILRTELTGDKRQDGLLHASSHLVSPLRHVQLELAGAPQLTESTGRMMPLLIGKLLHGWLEDVLRNLGVPYMAEVNVTPWMPKGWGGTADIVMFNPQFGAFVLVDVKTSKGESIRWRVERGASEEHIWQTSVYWHALRKMGLPMTRKIGVFYIPKNDTRKKDEEVEPVMLEFDPIPAKQLQSEMVARRKRVEEYRKSLPPAIREVTDYVTDALEEKQPRLQRTYFDRATGGHVLKLVPHWTSQFCPFPNELCDCRTHGTNTIGLFDDDGEYYPKPGYEEIEPEVFPEE